MTGSIGSYSPREALALAVRIEVEGADFYRRAAAESDDPGVRELFTFLLKEEEEHVATFRDLLSLAPGGAESTGEYDAYLRELAGPPIFPDRAVMLSDREALDLAIEAERAGILLYSEAAALASSAETGSTFSRLAAEERAHLMRLAGIRDRLFPLEAP
jgi:rubrerythrin